jgi:hypothetical protein
MADVTRPGVTKLAGPALLLLALAAPIGAGPGDDNRAPDLDGCEVLRVPAGNKVAFRAYAEGVQVYRWDGAGWALVGPEAWLFDQDGDVVGIHYAGPTWESNSGSTVKGAVLQRCTPDPDAIPWLLLGAVSSDGPGIFRRVTFIQRVNTAGGLAPAAPGAFPGEVARVPYAADYYFYRAHRVTGAGDGRPDVGRGSAGHGCDSDRVSTRISVNPANAVPLIVPCGWGRGRLRASPGAEPGESRPEPSGAVECGCLSEPAVGEGQVERLRPRHPVPIRRPIMSAQDPVEALPLDRRRAIFLTVVEVQDGGTAVGESRAEVARRFVVTEDEVKAIEREGLAYQWPPL